MPWRAGIMAWALALAMALGAYASAAKVARRIRTLREALAPVADPNAPPAAGTDELDALAEGVRRALRFGEERESALHRSAEFLRFAQCAGGFGIFDLDLASGEIEATPLFFDVIGIPSHGVLFHRDDWLATVHGEDFEAVVHALSHAIASGLNFDAEYRSRTLDGSVRWLASRGEIARGADGEPARLIGTITDVTVRKRLEESLKQKAESLSIAQTVAGIATMDLDLARQRWICSDNFYELMGLPAATPLGDWDARLRNIHPEDLERVRRAPLETTPRAPHLPLRLSPPARRRPGTLDGREGRRHVQPRRQTRAHHRARSWTSPSSSWRRPRSPRPRSASHAPCAARATACGSSMWRPDSFGSGRASRSCWDSGRMSCRVRSRPSSA